MTRVSFSDNPPTIDISMPTKWTELSDTELRTVFRVLDRYTGKNDSLPFQVFRRLAGMSIEREFEGKYLCAFRSGKKTIRSWISPELLAEHLDCLDFIFEPGSEPVRLIRIGVGRKKSYRGVNAKFHGVSFRDYVMLENLYQGFLATKDPTDILRMTAILYPGFRPEKDRIAPYEALSVIQWMVQVKGMFSRTFRNFFRPAGAGAAAPSMADVMNNEIRALTQGDVSKEAEIFEIDCWRCLTELDFKAKEAEEFNRIKNKK